MSFEGEYASDLAVLDKFEPALVAYGETGNRIVAAVSGKQKLVIW